MDNQLEEPPHVDEIAVCDPRPIIAEAIAWTLRRLHTADVISTSPTLTRLLTCMTQRVEIAIVSDAVEEDVADLFDALAHRGLPARVVILADDPTPAQVAYAIEIGAAGLLHSASSVEQLCSAIANVARHHRVFTPVSRTAVAAELYRRQERYRRSHHILTQLTELERRTLTSLASGVAIATIAQRFSISPRTVRDRTTALGRKLGVRGQMQIAAVGRELFATTAHHSVGQSQ